MTLAEALNARRWQTKRELARILKCTTREVEHLVEAARKKGELPIMSCGLGYRLASDPEEYEANVRNRRSRALNQLVTVRGERDHIRAWRAARSTPVPQPAQEALPWA